MPFEIVLSENFERRVKKLSKKYHSLEDDLLTLINSLELNPTQGASLGQDCYKIRLNITSKRAGKQGGARVITCVKVTDEQITLLTIIDKSEQETITEKELDQLLKKVFGN